jgi:hypothetical protein
MKDRQRRSAGFVVEKVRAVWVVFRVSGSFATLRMTARTNNCNRNGNGKCNY